MKKIIALLFVLALFVGCAGFSACAACEEPIRIHIRANSNSAEDQTVKLAVRDKLVDSLTVLLKEVKSRDDAKAVLAKNASKLAKTADKTLAENNFAYSARAKLTNEYFPARSYGGKVYDSGYYDALVVELGEGAGDNWWCVAYPPLCFYGSEDVEYSSIIGELIGR